MKLLLIATLALFSIVEIALGAEDPRLDTTGQFSYTLPEGWTVSSSARPNPKGAHDVLVLPAKDGKQRNIAIRDQPGKSPLADLQRKYERDLPQALKDFELISSELVELKNNHQALRIVHTNTAPGIAVRQVNYIVEVGGKLYFVAGTVLKGDGDKYDRTFEEFVTSMAPPDK